MILIGNQNNFEGWIELFHGPDLILVFDTQVLYTETVSEKQYGWCILLLKCSSTQINVVIYGGLTEDIKEMFIRH